MDTVTTTATGKAPEQLVGAAAEPTRAGPTVSVPPERLLEGLDASVTRAIAFLSLGFIMSSMTFGTICHETPNLSFSRPHCSAAGWSESLPQWSSISFWVSQCTMNEIASLKVNGWGWALSMAANSPPSSVKAACLIVPSRSGPPPWRSELGVADLLLTSEMSGLV